MKVEAIEVYQVTMPLAETWRTAASEETVIQAILVRMVSGEAKDGGIHATIGAVEPLDGVTPLWYTSRHWQLSVISDQLCASVGDKERVTDDGGSD